MSARSTESRYPKPAYAWTVIAILLLVNLLAYVDRQVIAIVVDPMKADLGVGDSQIAWLYSGFAIFYALAGLPIAWLADHKSRRAIIGVGIFTWGLMTMACGMARNFWVIFAARVGVGVGEATLSPATNSLVSDYFPRDKVPLALSVFFTGAIIGSGLAFIIGGVALDAVKEAGMVSVPYLGDLAPWQLTFIVVGAPGLVMAFLMFFVREPKRGAATVQVAADFGQPGSWAELLSFYRINWRTIVFHHIGFLGLILVGYTFVFWSVSYFVRVHGMASASASQLFGWIFLICGPIGPIAAGWFARYLTLKGRGDANILAAVIGACGILPAIIASQLAPSLELAVAAYIVVMLLLNSPFGLGFAVLPVITPPRLRARVTAIYHLMVSGGMAFGPVIGGYFNEFVFPGPDGVRFSVITITALFGFVGLFLLILARPHYAASLARAEAADRTLGPTP